MHRISRHASIASVMNADPLLLGGDRKPLIVLRNVRVAEPAVGRLDRVDAGQLQFFRQAVLQRLERSLRSPACLRRVRRNVLDAELLQRTAELRQHGLRHRPAALGVKK
jgi:hypothetical protein